MKQTRHDGGAVRGGMLAAAIVSVSLLGGTVAEAQRSAGGRSPIYLEDSPDANDLLANASELVQASRFGEAAAVYQTLLQNYGRKLVNAQGVKATDRTFLHVDIRVYVCRELSNNAPLLEAYQRLYEGEAAAQLAAAMEGKQPNEDGAPNEATVSTPAGIRANIGAIERVYRKYWLCASGLEAGLRLAGLSLARGSIADSMAVLDALAAHPLLSKELTRYHQLQAAAGIFGGDALRLKKARQALSDRHEDASLALIKLWESNAKPIVPGASVQTSLAQVKDPAATQPALSMPTNLSKPVWSMTIADVIARDAAVRMGGMASVATPTSAPTLPVVDGDRLLINMGDDVIAIERHSGRKLWSARRSNPVTAVDGVANLRMRSPYSAPTQPRGVVMEGSRKSGAVITAVVGLSNFNAAQFGGWAQGAAPATVLMGINAGDGKVLWEVSPTDIDETLDQGAFVGTPAMFGGRTYVLLRRAQMQGLQHTLVVAVDSATGRLLWKRALASANYLSGPLGAAYLNISGGRLFVGDSLGTTVCLDSYDGTIRWLNTSGGKMINEVTDGRFGFGGGQRQQVVSPTHEPIFIEAGVLIPAGAIDESNSQPAAIVLDPDTGRIKGGFSDAVLKDSLWSEAEYVTKVDGDILVVGATIARLDGKTLAIKWSRRLDAIRNAKLAGTPAVTSDLVVVPTADRILAFQLDGGKIVFDADVESPGNLLLLSGQLICVNDREVRGFLDWKVAYDRLKAQIERDGKTESALSAALTLSQLASAAGQREAMLEGADLALASASAIASTGTADVKRVQRELFDQLLALADSDRYIEVATRRALFERVAAASQSPSDEVIYRLAFAKRLSGGKFYDDAVEQYQGVLADQVLSAQLYERGGESRLAGLEARVQLGKLIGERGQEIYAKFDALASQRFADLTANGAPRDSAALVELARQIPYAKVVPAALFAAGETLHASGNHAEAIVQLRRAYSMSRDADFTPRLSGTLASAYIANKQQRQALVWLMRLKLEHPDLQPVRAGAPVALDAWIAELSSQSRSEDQLPSLELPLGQPKVIEGTLLTPTAQNEDSWPADRLMVRRGNIVKLFGGDKLTQLWQIEVPADDAPIMSLVSFSRVSCVFYLPVSGVVRVVDSQTGRDLWTTRKIGEMLSEVGTPADRRKAVSPEQRKFMEEVNQGNLIFRNGKPVTPRDLLTAEPALFTKCNEQIVCVADHLGRVVGLDRVSGRIVWKLLCPFDRLDFLEISGETLALAGRTAFTSEASTGNVLIIDPQTGETRKSVDDKDAPQWVAVGEDGRLLVATFSQLLCRSNETGDVSWRINMPEQTLTNFMRMQGDILMTRIETGEILAIDTMSGQIVNRFTNTESTTAPDAFVLRAAQDNWHFLTSTSATMLDRKGKVRWRDAVRPEEKRFVSQLISDRYVTLVSVVRSPQDSLLLPGSDEFGNVAAPSVFAPRSMRPGMPEEAMDQPKRTNAGEWEFKLFFVDRQSGKIAGEQPLSPIQRPLNPKVAMMLNHRLVLTAGNAVIVLPDATLKP